MHDRIKSEFSGQLERTNFCCKSVQLPNRSYEKLTAKIRKLDLTINCRKFPITNLNQTITIVCKLSTRNTQ